MRCSQEVERLSHNRGAGCLAVLSSDSRLTLEIIRLAIKGNMRAIVFGPNIQPFYREQFESHGAEVRHLSSERSIPFKVRGVLHTDKTGTYELADSEFLPAGDCLHRTKYLLDFLKSVGWLMDEDDIITRAPQTLVKFWFHHFHKDCVGLHGSLTVFPIEQLIWTMYDLVQHGENSWQPRLSEYAYCTPLACCSKLSKEAAQKYGGIRQRRLLLGGGPFVLEDSDDLSERMMKRLGYLDEYNNDIQEAGLVFCQRQ